MKRFTFLIGVAAAALATTTPAIAQEVVMRRPLIVPTKGAEWRVSPFLIYDTNGNVVQPQNACGPYEERRDVQCVVNERPVGDSYCRDVGPKPEESKQSFIDTGCSYDWYQGQWQDPGPSCSNAEGQERVVECRRSYDDVKVSDSLCSGTKPDTARTVVDHSTCTYSWNSTDPFADPGQNCTATEEWTRDVFCERDLDKVQVADGQCGGSKPATVDVREDYSSCSYSWKSDETFTDPGDSCTSEENQTRAVWCERDLDGNVEQDAKCNGATRPAASQTVEDFSGCDYEWKTGAWQDPGASCTSTERQTRSVTCLRSDGTTVTEGCDVSERPAASQDVADYSSCSYSWIEGGFGAWTSTCSNSATRSQTVNCRRSDGTIMTGSQESLCSGTKPAQTEGPTGIYSTCGYTANYGSWSACDGTSRTRTMATCTRSTGDNVALSNCTSRGDQLTQTESCVTYAWVAGTWNAWNNTCTANSTRTQNYYCRASNGQTVADGNCAGPKPTNSETAPNYTGCTYTLVDSGVGACDGTQRPHYWGCRRDQTGEMVYSGTYCGRENPTYEACQTYAWEASTWNGWNSTCSSNATRTQNFICRASNGSVVADGNCAGPKPTNSETGPNYSSCTYTASYTGWGACDGTNQTRSMNLCTRNQTGESVAGEYCVNQGYPWTQSQNCYSYQWIAGAWQDPGNSCTPYETQTRSVICRRSDGATVGDASCGGGKPATAQTVEDYSGCQGGTNLTVNWGDWSGWSSSCSTSATRTRSGTCMASGVPVSSSVCTSRGVAVTGSESSAQYSTCAYTPTYGGFSACSNSSQSAPMTACTRIVPEGNQNVGIGECTSRGHPNPKTQSCTPPAPRIGEICVGGTNVFSVAEEYSSGTTEGWAMNSCRAQGGNCLEVDRYTFPRSGRSSGSLRCRRNAVPSGEPYDSRNDDPYAEDYQERYSQSL